MLGLDVVFVRNKSVIDRVLLQHCSSMLYSQVSSEYTVNMDGWKGKKWIYTLG